MLVDPPPSRGELEHAAVVAIGPGAVGSHAGIYYRDADGSTRLQHLARHLYFADESIDISDAAATMGFVDPTISPEKLDVVAEVCSMIREVPPEPAYGFRFEATEVDGSNRIVVGPGEIGLTCSTYVLAVYRRCGIDLLAVASWARAPEARLHADREAQEALVDLYARARHPIYRAHATRLRAEIGAPRFRPEEVAVASASVRVPLDLETARVSGAVLMDAARRRPWWAPDS